MMTMICVRPEPGYDLRLATCFGRSDTTCGDNVSLYTAHHARPKVQRALPMQYRLIFIGKN